MTSEMKDKICTLVEDVEYKVAKGLSEEIRRLAVLVDEFSDPFHPDPLVVNVYKSKLNHHLESGVGSNLKARLSSDLQVRNKGQNIEQSNRASAVEHGDPAEGDDGPDDRPASHGETDGGSISCFRQGVRYSLFSSSFISCTYCFGSPVWFLE